MCITCMFVNVYIYIYIYIYIYTHTHTHTHLRLLLLVPLHALVRAPAVEGAAHAEGASIAKHVFQTNEQLETENKHLQHVMV